MNPISLWLNQFRLYIEIAIAVLLVIGFLLFVHHERVVGADNLQHSIDAATAKVQRDAERQTRVLQAKADEAQRKADETQKSLDDYAAHHPSGPVSLCFASSRISILPPAAGALSVGAGTGTGPDAVPAVQGGDVVKGPDVSGEFDALVQSSQRLAVLYAQGQQRP